jgi:glycerate-2-kinase
MKKHWIKNYNELATTENRKLAFEIAEAGLDAINTENVVLKSVKLEQNILNIKGESFDLSKFKKIKVVGFGKCSIEGALALEKILGDKISEGAVVGLYKIPCEYIETFEGTHPRPTELNVKAGKRIFDIVNGSTEEDLIIVVVSGGGSALLSYPESEYIQGQNLYDAFLETGKTISEMNTIRKHLSLLKGGGLAKIAYPATVVGLIFSDVPGDKFEDVASGPTYKDNTTIKDAEAIINVNNLGNFELIETPKEDKYFEKVHNFVLVSNKTAVEVMAEKSKELGFNVKVVSTDLYDEVEESLHKIFNEESDNTVVLAAGEPKLVVKKKGGSGGRNLYMSLEEIKFKMTDNKSVFIALASDGMDNSDAAGAVVDENTFKNIERLGIDVEDHIEKFDAYPVFKRSGDMIITGPTGANVSDLMILLTRK